jgi:uncharacterized protein YndB with AHSA1/START domain
MAEKFIAKSESIFKAPPEKIWEALTEPSLVKQWLFGTDMSVSSWEVGGKIQYKGVWEGKSYEDKGEILEIEPQKKLVSSYFSGLSGKEDIPENYQRVSYILEPVEGGTKLIITQEGNPTEASAKHSEGNWNMVLDSMKKVVEK